MATWTEAQVVNAALERLGVKAAGQSAGAEDYASMLAAWRSLYPRLRRKGHALWPIDEVEEEAQELVATVLADIKANQFGFTGQRRMELAADAKMARAELAEQASGDKHDTPIVSEYF